MGPGPEFLKGNSLDILSRMKGLPAGRLGSEREKERKYEQKNGKGKLTPTA
jgi:hypothetical protein